MFDWIGYQWLGEKYGIEPVQPFSVRSCIGRSRTSHTTDGLTRETYQEATRPEASDAGHLAFALRREGIHLEFLARLFEKMPPEAISEWAQREPSGQYARRAGFLYEWLTGRTLDFAGVEVGNYIEALPSEQYLSATVWTNVARWRVRNNLPGTQNYCPLVRRTPAVRVWEDYDIRARLDELETEFGTDILMRSAVWLTIKESRASFEIEHEAHKEDRVELFAQAMERWSGFGDSPLNSEFLLQIQTEILGKRALRLGLRQSPVFVGETTWRGEFVHYVAPGFEQVSSMLDGLQQFERSTKGAPSLVRAGVLSFGFVFIHPLTDGNGRISRFLVNDTLRRDVTIPRPYIVPISSTIMRSIAQRAAYDQILERYSRPFMARYRSACSFDAPFVCADGVKTNFSFSAYDEARFTWAFPDLTEQVQYLGEVVRQTVEMEMRQEADYLHSHSRLRSQIKEIMEAPDVEIDRLIRSIRQNNGVISGKLAKEFPPLSDSSVASAIVAVILEEPPVKPSQ